MHADKHGNVDFTLDRKTCGNENDISALVIDAFLNAGFVMMCFSCALSLRRAGSTHTFGWRMQRWSKTHLSFPWSLVLWFFHLLCGLFWASFGPLQLIACGLLLMLWISVSCIMGRSFLHWCDCACNEAEPDTRNVTSEKGRLSSAQRWSSCGPSSLCWLLSSAAAANKTQTTK